jgi:hypothetical protein
VWQGRGRRAVESGGVGHRILVSMLLGGCAEGYSYDGYGYIHEKADGGVEGNETAKLLMAQ